MLQNRFRRFWVAVQRALNAVIKSGNTVFGSIFSPPFIGYVFVPVEVSFCVAMAHIAMVQFGCKAVALGTIIPVHSPFASNKKKTGREESNRIKGITNSSNVG